MKIAVYTICKDEEQFAKRYAEQAREADAIIVTDTGSSDQTIPLLTSGGAQINAVKINPFRFDYAFNAAIDNIPEDFDACFRVDLDEVIEPGWRSIVEREWNDNVICIDRPTVGDKIFGLYRPSRIHPRHNFRWQGAIHERLIGPGVKRDSDLRVIHTPDHKKDRNYLPYARMGAAEDPTSAGACYLLVAECFKQSQFDEAYMEANRYLTIPCDNKNERSDVYKLMGQIFELRKEYDRATELFERANTESPVTRDALYCLAMMEHRRGKNKEAAIAARRALAITTQDGWCTNPDAWSGILESLAKDFLSEDHCNIGTHSKIHKNGR